MKTLAGIVVFLASVFVLTVALTAYLVRRAVPYLLVGAGFAVAFYLVMEGVKSWR